MKFMGTEAWGWGYRAGLHLRHEGATVLRKWGKESRNELNSQAERPGKIAFDTF